MNYLKQSTAADIGIGPFVDSTDGNTPETALTITAPDIRLKKNGGAWAQKNAAQTLTHEEAGWYEVALDATDTNTLGILIVAIHESGALPVWRDFQVLPANVFDSLVSGSDKLEVDLTQISGDTTAADNCELFFDDTGFNASNSLIGGVNEVTLIAANGINAASITVDSFTAAKFAADVGTEFATAVWALATRTLSGTQTFNNTGTWTGNLSGSVGSVTAMVTANMIQLSGDSAAADNLETMLDGTGGQALTLKNVVINNGAGIGLSITGSTVGMQVVGTATTALVLSGGTYGLNATGITAGLRADCAGTGPGLECVGSGATGPGALFTGAGSGAGIKAEGDSTGAGLEVTGGATSGAGLKATGAGAFAGIEARGGATGDGIIATGGATSGAGLYLSIDGGTDGLFVEGDSIMNITGTFTGNLSGSVGSIATGGITAGSIAANAIGASELAADAVAEIVAAIGGVGAFAITVTVNDGAAALQNVNVSLYDGGGALAGRGTTDASGNASFSLAAGTYTVALVKANYQFAPVSRTVTGNQAGSLVTALSMSIIAPIVASVDPDLCVVAGYIKDLNGNALVGSLVKVWLEPPNKKRPITSDGNVLGLEADTAVTDALGYVSFELIRTDEIDQEGCTYVIKCEDAKMEKRNVQLITATLDIATL